MNKINIYVLTFFLSLAGVSIYAQNNRSQVVITSGQDNNVFFHTIERATNCLRNRYHVRGYAR